MKTLLLSLVCILSMNIQAQQTYVPDDNFEAFLEANAMGNGIPNDNYVTTANINTVTGLYIFNQNISDVTGIEDFAALETLTCMNNSIVSLDLSQNSALTYVDCGDNLITSINVNGCGLLSTLVCTNNQLALLDVSQNPSLGNLGCSSNLLTALDVSSNNSLTSLSCSNNLISNLVLSPSITSLGCGNNSLASLDVSGLTLLGDLGCSNNLISNLVLSPSITSLDCSNNSLASLDVSGLTSLSVLTCNNNSLYCLIANNGQDIDLNCSNNFLTCVSTFNPSWSVVNSIYDPSVNFNQSCSPPSLNNSVVQIGNQLTSQQVLGTYQWLDCDNFNAPIVNETNQVFTATETGSYAVALSLQSCNGLVVDVSNCVYVNCQSLIDNDVTQNNQVLTALQDNASYQWLDCDNNNSVILGETNQTYSPSINGNYAVEITITDACGVVRIDTSTCANVNFAGIEELLLGKIELVKIVDLLGRETEFKPNTPLIYIYSDGTIERVFKLED